MALGIDLDDIDWLLANNIIYLAHLYFLRPYRFCVGMLVKAGRIGGPGNIKLRFAVLVGRGVVVRGDQPSQVVGLDVQIQQFKVFRNRLDGQYLTASALGSIERIGSVVGTDVYE